MPKVKQYQQNQVSTQITPGAQARELPASAFTVGTYGKAVGQIANDLDAVSQKMDTTAAEEAMNGFEKDKNALFFNPESGYFNTQGRNAFDQAKSTNEALIKLKQSYSDGLKSPRARQAFDKVASQHVSRGNVDIMRHSSKGAQAWEVATINATVENTLETASLYWNQPDAIRVQNELGRMAVVDSSEMRGIGAEATAEALQTYDSSFAQSVIRAATNTSGGAGQSAMDTYGSMLEGPDKIQMNNLIKSKKKADETANISSQSILKAGVLVGTYETRKEVMAEAKKISDPKLRKATMREADYLLSQEKQIKDEEQAEIFQTISEGQREAGFSLDVFIAAEPEQWEKLSVSQQDKLLKGDSVVTNKALFADLRLLPKEQLAKLDPNDYLTELSPADHETLVSDIKTARNKSTSKEKIDSQVGRGRTAQTTSAVTQIFGKRPIAKGSASKKKLTQYEQKINAFYDLVDSEYEYRRELKGSDLSSEEYTDMLSGLTRSVVMDGDELSPAEVFDEVPPSHVDAISGLLRDDRLPVTNKNLMAVYNTFPELAKQLHDRGIPVTDENLIKLYKQVY